VLRATAPDPSHNPQYLTREPLGQLETIEALVVFKQCEAMKSALLVGYPHGISFTLQHEHLVSIPAGQFDRQPVTRADSYAAFAAGNQDTATLGKLRFVGVGMPRGRSLGIGSLPG
jgi:hypothetical protein